MQKFKRVFHSGRNMKLLEYAIKHDALIDKALHTTEPGVNIVLPKFRLFGNMNQSVIYVLKGDYNRCVLSQEIPKNECGKRFELAMPSMRDLEGLKYLKNRLRVARFT